MDNNSAIKREKLRQKRESARCLYKARKAVEKRDVFFVCENRR